MNHRTIKPDPATPRHRVGCVSYLNALPLIEGLASSDCHVIRCVPSGLLELLTTGAVDIALCPVADLMLSETPLRVVPAGGIGCDGPTLTVRLFSKVPFDRVTTLHADTDSHTSVRLARVLLAERFGVTPETRPLDARHYDPATTDAQTLLLIGDKVITAAPDQADYPHQLDAGDAWKQLTGLPFVFAAWLVADNTTADALADLPVTMAHLLDDNLERVELLARQHAPSFGWPIDTATHYLRDLLRYRIGKRQLEAIEHYLGLCHKHGLNPAQRGLELVPGWPPERLKVSPT